MAAYPSYNTYMQPPQQSQNQMQFLNQANNQMMTPPNAPMGGFMQPTLFPQPTGNVYNINNTLEVANIPAGAGLTVALCLPEGLMYVKTMQNGSPMFLAYRIMPADLPS